MITISLEIRWFFEGYCPTVITDWIKIKGCISEEQMDHYLALPEEHSSFIGIKKSRGTFDIKYRKQMYHFIMNNANIVGKVELWDKCMLKLNDPINYSFQGIAFDQVKIEKVRYKKGYNIDFPSLVVTPTTDNVIQGVKLEITTIDSKFGKWWSLAFDCFADTLEKQKEILHKGIENILLDYKGPKLTLENSFSYPEWISKLQ